MPLSRSACDAGHAALYDLSSRLPGAIQQESIQHAAGKNSDWLNQVKANAPSCRTYQFTLLDPVALDLRITQERILRKRLVGDTSSTRFFPGQLLVEQKDVAAGTGERGCR